MARRPMAEERVGEPGVGSSHLEADDRTSASRSSACIGATDTQPASADAQVTKTARDGRADTPRAGDFLRS